MSCVYRESENKPNGWDGLGKIFRQSTEVATWLLLALIVKIWKNKGRPKKKFKYERSRACWVLNKMVSLLVSQRFSN